ncbi:hypothetical protein BU17DRAFT_100971 [Hysterangium stoloniferum]|nr:hypothetical protein BU17DRAFT_100971 [Hysterangium stoloniferum]
MLQLLATTLAPPLVQSYDHISDLENNIHIITSSAQRAATLQISALELKRTQHLAALNTGLLVEKTHVTSELNRLMGRATEEAARRGVAESVQQEIERDLDGLSAKLFGRANAMVAEARLAAAKSERKVQEAEAGLRGAEDAVRAMQEKMQALQAEKERVPPPIATLLPLPFLTRLVAEDSDPTLRLDAAPALNWLTRRTVTAAIHTAQLTIEPLPVNAILQTSSSDQHCALCGKSVLPALAPATISTPTQSQASNGPKSWRPAFLKNQKQDQNSSSQGQSHSIHSPTPSIATSASFYPPSTSTPPLTPPPTTTSLPSISTANTNTSSPAVYVFRLQTPTACSSPFLALHKFNTTSSTYYTLCNPGWCLSRLRMTCELWRFVRVGIVGSVWEEMPTFSPPPQHPQTMEVTRTASSSISSSPTSTSPRPPAVPPRRRVGMGMNMSVGKLFGMALESIDAVTNEGCEEWIDYEWDVAATVAEEDSGSAVKPDVEANPASLTKPTQGLTTSEALPLGGVDLASVSLPPSPIKPEMIFDHDEHDHDHDHEDEHIKAKTQNHPCKIKAPVRTRIPNWKHRRYPPRRRIGSVEEARPFADQVFKYTF